MPSIIPELYGEKFDFSLRPSSPTTTIMIATVPRTGSTHLCVELWRTGLAGAPMEYLNLCNRRRDMIPRLGGGDALAYWHRLPTVRTTSNGVFSYKAFPQDFQQISADKPEIRFGVSPSFVVYLRRRDKLAQAVSYYRASLTNAWFSHSGERNPAEYSEKGIDIALGWISALEKRWRNLFFKAGCTPLDIFYEDLLDSPEVVIGSVLRFCDIDGQFQAKIPLPAMNIQRDNKSAAWMERYLDDKRLNHSSFFI